MSRAKVFISILMVLILIALSGASVWAAPNGQDLISGVVQGIEIVTEVDPDTGETTTTVLVTLIVDETTGETQTVRVSVDTAIGLGLVQTDENGDPVLDEDGNPIPNDAMIGQPVEIDPSDVIEEDGEEGLHPVASALAEFFATKLGLNYDMIMSYHEDGMGFGVIAQACWMSYALEGDATLLGDILEAKKSHDFSSIELPDGETPKNWGQFKKVVLGSKKAQRNLGEIMSRREKQNETDGDDLGATANQGQGKGKKGKGPSEDGPPGKSKKGSEGGGPPAEPPGKVKNKDKGKGGGKKE